MKLAFAAIVKGVDEEAETLMRLLANVSLAADDLFITITHKKDEKPSKKIIDTCEMFGAKISYFEWINDFSVARNYNFSQVPKNYTHILWGDADDMFRNIEKLPNILKENPNVDTFTMNYLYWFDEYKNPIVVHLKTQVVKNDNCVEWAGRLHEDFKENRQVSRFLIKDIERLHLSDEKRAESAKLRNLEISQAQQEAEPNDPRSYWNLGNSQKAAGKNEDAIKSFDKFLETSQSDEEKYIVRLRMAEAYLTMGNMGKAIDEARYAIGTRPEYPDAYHLLGNIYFNSGMMMDAAKNYISGLTKKPPYYTIMVYNPRDYDYVPMMNLAKVYFAMQRPQLALPLLKGCLKICPKDKNLKNIINVIKKKADVADKIVKKVSELKDIKDKELLKKEIDKLPQEFKSHPDVCHLRNINFIKETSSGKDIAYYCGFTEDIWNPDIAKEKGIGGSEEAVIHISKRLAKLGGNVTVYNNCGHEEKIYDGVIYKPFWAWNYRDKQDVVILWRANVRFADYNINSEKVIIDLHDVMPEGEFINRLPKIYKIFVKSKFHRSLFPNIPDDKFVVVPNGIEPEKFEQDIKRDNNLLINTSSPDRGLNCLVDLFSEVKKQIPEARLKWAYGWKVFDVIHAGNSQMVEWKKQLVEKMKFAGVEELGRIGHDDIAKLYQEAGIFAYPSEFAEIDCISLSKAMAAGAIPVTTDFSAMGEKQGHGGYFIHSQKNKDTWYLNNKFDFSIEDEEIKKEWINKTIETLKNPPSEEERIAMREWAIETFNWDKISNVWMMEF